MKFDTLIIGGGEAGIATAAALAGAGRKVALITEGLTLRSLDTDGQPYKFLQAAAAAGVTVLRGDSAVEGIREGARITSVRTRNGLTISADTFVLATGRFFSRGLAADMSRIYEPVFGADVEAPAARTEWFSPDFFAPQPFESAGVKVDGSGRISIEGTVIENVYAAGDIICRAQAAASAEESGAKVAGEILKKN